MLLPLLWMISTSLQGAGRGTAAAAQVDLASAAVGELPQTFRCALPFDLFLINSIKIAVFATVGSPLELLNGGLRLRARMRFPGRNVIFAVILATMMIPLPRHPHSPLQALSRHRLAQHTPAAHRARSSLGTAFGIFLMRQFYLTIPQELVEAARHRRLQLHPDLFTASFCPSPSPALATLGIFTFLGSWNNLMGPLIFLTKVETMTITLGLTLLTNQSGGRWELIQAGAVISILPIIVMFFIGQEHFIQGIARTGIKG